MTVELANPKELESLAFDLLSSSSLDRYLRMAQRAAAASELAERLAADNPRLGRRIVDRVDRLIASIATAEARVPEEVELVLLLSVLARSGVSESDAVLRRAALLPHSAARWVAGAARQLLAGYSATHIYPLHLARGGSSSAAVGAAGAGVGAHSITRSRATFATINRDADSKAA